MANVNPPMEDFYTGKPEPKIKKTVTPDKPIKSFNSWIAWVYRTVKRQAA